MNTEERLPEPPQFEPPSSGWQGAIAGVFVARFVFMTLRFGKA